MKFKILNPNQFHFEYQFKFTISNSPLASTNSLVRHSHSQVANFVPPFASSDSQKVQNFQSQALWINVVINLFPVAEIITI